MKKLFLFGVFILISVLTFAQQEASNNDTVRVKLQKAKVQPRDVSKKNVEVKETNKTNPEKIQSGNKETIINRKEN